MEDDPDMVFHSIIRTDINRLYNDPPGEYERLNKKKEIYKSSLERMNASQINNLYDRSSTVIISYCSQKYDMADCQNCRFNKTKSIVYVAVITMHDSKPFRNLKICTTSLGSFQRRIRACSPKRIYTIQYATGRLVNFQPTDAIFRAKILIWRGCDLCFNFDPLRPLPTGGAVVPAVGEVVPVVDAVDAVDEVVPVVDAEEEEFAPLEKSEASDDSDSEI